MNFITFREKLKDFHIFSTNDIKMIAPAFFSQRLVEWQKKGYIRKIIRNYYVFSGTEADEHLLFLTANKIYKPSYVSFETALAYYGLIPENVYLVTSASTRKTYVFNTPLGKFSYNSLKKSLFFGYKPIRYGKENFLIATAEKALLDYLYINAHIKTMGDIAELRLNRDAARDMVRLPVLDEYSHRFGSKTLEKKTGILKEYFKNA